MKKYILVCIVIIMMCIVGCVNEEYAAAVSGFDEATKTLKEKNDIVKNEIEKADKLISEKKNVLDETIYIALENAISNTKKVLIDDIECPEKIEEIVDITNKINSIEYELELIELRENIELLERSIQQFSLVDMPDEKYVIECLNKVPNVGAIASVTEETDPMGKINKAGWYIAHIYFSCLLIEQDEIFGTTIIEKGTDAGGSIEIYKTVDEANKRNEYLSTFDGTVLGAGSHIVIGTCVIRTSDKLTATQQKKLETDIINILVLLPGEEYKAEQEKETQNSDNRDEKETDTTSNKDDLNKYEEETTNNKESVDNINQQVINIAKQLENKYATIFPSMLKMLLMSEYGYGELEAIYAVNNSEIDWNYYAVIHLEEYVFTNDYRVTSDNIEWHLSVEKGYSEENIKYAFENADIKWDKMGDRSELAVEKAVELAKEFFPTDRAFVRKVLLEPSIQQDFSAFTNDETDYAIKNADIEWEKHLLERMNEYVKDENSHSPTGIRFIFENNEYTEEEIQYAIDNCYADWNECAKYYAEYVKPENGFSPIELQEYLIENYGFTESQAKYGGENGNVDWRSFMLYYEIPDAYINYAYCTSCGNIRGECFVCPICGGATMFSTAYAYTKEEVIEKLAEAGFEYKYIEELIAKNFDGGNYYGDIVFINP